MIRIFFTGIQGLLGSNFLLKEHKNLQIVGTYFKSSKVKIQKRLIHLKLDIREKDQVKMALERYKPHILIHAASLGDVDYCENNRKEAFQTNVLGTTHLAEAAKKINAKFIFLSSNAVFDGNRAPYSEKSRPRPINFYGKTKLEAEIVVNRILKDFTILRLNTMYGWHKAKHRDNPTTWILSKLEKKEKIMMVDDIFNNHLYVKSASEAISKIINQSKTEKLYHIGGADCMNRYDFAKIVAKVFRHDKNLIYPVHSTFFDKIAPRPKNTCFKLTKMETILKIKPWKIEEGIRDLKKSRKQL